MKDRLKTLMLIIACVLVVSTTAVAAEGIEAERRRLYRNLSEDPNLNTPAEIEERIAMRFKIDSAENSQPHLAIKVDEHSLRKERVTTQRRLPHRKASDHTEVNTRKAIKQDLERKPKPDVESQHNVHTVGQRFEALEKTNKSETAVERERRRLLYRDPSDRADLNTPEEIKEYLEMMF